MCLWKVKYNFLFFIYDQIHSFQQMQRSYIMIATLFHWWFHDVTFNFAVHWSFVSYDALIGNLESARLRSKRPIGWVPPSANERSKTKW